MPKQTAAPGFTIICPQCKFPVPLTETLAGPALEAERQRHAEERAQMERAQIDALRIATEAAQRKGAEDARAQAEGLRHTLETRTREALAEREAARQREAALMEKLEEAARKEAAAVRLQRELADAKREIELTVEKRVTAIADTIRTDAARQAAEAAELRAMEHQEMIAGLRRQIDDLRQRAEQGSQQLQGEAQELAIEALLSATFPSDTVEPVGKGVNGADCVLRVFASPGREAGSIVIESKRTKSWSAGWLAKLREDQRAAGADVAILASQALPPGVSVFECIEGVWVCSVAAVAPLVAALRAGLLSVAAVKRNAEGAETKAQLVYGYVTGQAFRHRIQAAVEAVTALQTNLEAERRALTRQWAKREVLHTSAIAAVVGMHGDVAGIAGAELPEIEAASMKALESAEE